MALAYLVLGFWSFIVLFPLYWVFITSFKIPLAVNDGPFYLMWVDFQPSLHAWKYIFVDLGSDTFRPYLHSVIVALASSVIALRPRQHGGLRARAHDLPAAARQHRPVRARGRPRDRRRGRFRRGLGSRTGAGIRDLPLAGPDLRAPLQARARQRRHRVLDDLATHPAAGRGGHPGLRAVPADGPARFAGRPDHHLRRGQPADRGLADARLFPDRAARAGGVGDDRRRLALSDLLVDRAADRARRRWRPPSS